MSYTAPVTETHFWLKNVLDHKRIFVVPEYSQFSDEDLNQILKEIAKIAEEEVAPLNQRSDKNPAKLENGVVRTEEGFLKAYKILAEGGWLGISGNVAYGGLGLPLTFTSCFNEYLGSACLSFSLLSLMTQGQIDALETHATKKIKDIFLPRLNSGDWTGTMNLTEPQAGSDVGALTTKAIENEDGSFSITGQKIYISWGDHNLAKNVCHLVLARLDNSPTGSKGISLFLVPKYIEDQDGEWVIGNNVTTLSLEHKMGLHGSPTAVMDYKDSKGWIIGEKNQGLSAMFTMMNNARLGVGVEGLSQCELATQKAIFYAKNRKQGKSNIKNPEGSIIDHADVRRNLLTMKSVTSAVRALCLDTAVSLDLSRSKEENMKKFHSSRAAFLIPIAKAFSTEMGCELADIAIQVHGGMGYIEETGVAQVYRDVRVTAIYEGTNGIQAMDLVGRKLLDKGKVAFKILDEINQTVKQAMSHAHSDIIEMGQKLDYNSKIFSNSLDWMLSRKSTDDRYAGSMPFLRAIGYLLGGHYLLKASISSPDDEWRALSKFYVYNLLERAAMNSRIACSGPESLYDFDKKMFGS